MSPARGGGNLRRRNLRRFVAPSVRSADAGHLARSLVRGDQDERPKRAGLDRYRVARLKFNLRPWRDLGPDLAVVERDDHLPVRLGAERRDTGAEFAQLTFFLL